MWWCRKEEPFPGPKSGLLSNRNELSRETNVLTKQKTSLGTGAWVESSSIMNPEELLCHMACTLRFYGNRVSFCLVPGKSFWLRGRAPPCPFLVEHSLLSQDGFQGKGFWEDAMTYRLVSHLFFWLFSSSFGGWQIVSSEFFTKTSCCEMTHAGGYYRAWPG